MPVVQVSSLRPPDPQAVPRLLATLPDAVAAAVGCLPRDVWVYWQEVGAARIATAHEGWVGHCPVVVIRARTRDELQVRRGLDAAAHAVAAAFALPLEDVWAQWVEIEPGRVYAGGSVH